MSDDGQQWREADGSAGGPAPPDLRCLVLVEIAGFGDLRRLLGIARADLLVIDVAERIAAVLPQAGVATVGRNLIEIGLSLADQACVEATIALLHATFARPLSIDGEAHRIALTIGTALPTGPGCDDIWLVEMAEEQLRRERRTRQETPVAPVAMQLDDESVLSRELEEALERNELFLQYQPKLHLRRDEIGSVEALIRWQHPRRGLVLPNDFIPAAERTGDILPVTLWTIRQAIADQRVLMRNGQDLTIFINIAGQLLSNGDFVDLAMALVQESGAKLGFEITETSVIRDPDSAILHLQRLAAMGVVITIDDYGAGLSSLAYLKQLPARELKIDKLFVTQLTSSHRDPLIVRSTIDLAHALEMEVVAEGVETPTSLALLAVMGCDMVQGFLISRPLALEALLVYLREERHRTIAKAPKSPLERLAAVRARA